MVPTNFAFIVLNSLLITSLGLKCYEGSRGIVNNEDSSNFVENQCDDNMTYCFESYNSNLTEVTASCQSMGTDPKLIDVCKMSGACRERSDIDVTVCCCTSDLCNLQDDLKPTPDPDTPDIEETNSTSTISSTDKFIEYNETMGLELNDTIGL